MGKRLGLIGLGAFGQLAGEHLRDHFEIVAADAANRSADATRLGIDWGSVTEAATLPYVLLAVPVQSFGEVLEQIRGVVQPGTLVIDVASVKIGPVREMTRVLPDNVEILATHPMFGPESAGTGITGHRIAVCPVRTARLEAAETFLSDKLGLEVHTCDAETHDREIAHTQALAQFVGRALAMLEESASPVRTPGYDHFREVAETVGRDTWELFTAIQNLNPYAAEMRAELLSHLNDLQDRLAREASVSGGPGNPGNPGDPGGPGGPGGPDGPD